jgi:predicted NBD/HSP70 family sugar kinase
LVLGGGVIEAIPELVTIVNNMVPQMALEAAVKNLKIVRAALGGDAAVIGAASLAQSLVELH